MKKKNLVLGILIIVAIKVYSQDIAIDINTPLELTHFKQIFKKYNPDIPLDTLNYSDSKSYSNDKSLYLKYIPEQIKYRLMTYDDKYITSIPYTSVYDKIIWLKNCVVVENSVQDFNYPVIYMVDLKSGDLSFYQGKGWLSYIGHSDSICYFYSQKDSISIGDFLVPDEYTIFSINEKGLMITDKKEREDDNKIVRKYYNESFSLVINEDSSGKSSYNFHYFDSVWTYNEPVVYFDDRNVYHRNGDIYVRINTKAIYRFDKNNVTEVLDCDTLSIDQFMIENNHLIYSLNYDYRKPPLGILNLQTKQTLHPFIKQED